MISAEMKQVLSENVFLIYDHIQLSAPVKTLEYFQTRKHHNRMPRAHLR